MNFAKTQNTTSLISILGVPVYIGLHYNWWMGVISFVLSFILNSLIGWLLIFNFPIADKPYIPYLKMLIIAMILISVSHLIVG